MSQCRAVPTSIFTTILMLGMMAVILALQLQPQALVDQNVVRELALIKQQDVTPATDAAVEAAHQEAEPESSFIADAMEESTEVVSEQEEIFDDQPEMDVVEHLQPEPQPEMEHAAVPEASLAPEQDPLSEQALIVETTSEPEMESDTTESTAATTEVFRGADRKDSTYVATQPTRWEVVGQDGSAVEDTTPQPAPTAQQVVIQAPRTFATAIYRGTSRQVTLFEVTEEATEDQQPPSEDAETPERPDALSTNRPSRSSSDPSSICELYLSNDIVTSHPSQVVMIDRRFGMHVERYSHNTEVTSS